MAGTYLGTVQTVKLNAIFKRPTTNYNSILFDRNLNLSVEATMVNGEMRVTLVGERAYVFSQKTEKCINNGEAGKFPVVEVTIRNSDFETLDKVCREEIEALACSSEARTTIAEIVAKNDFPMNENSIVGLIYTLYIQTLIERGLKERAICSMFGDADFTPSSITPGRRNGITTGSPNYKFFERSLSKQNGVWTDILNSIAGTSPLKAQYFDTNDGTSGGNILNPNNTLDMIRGLLSIFTPEQKSRKNETLIFLDPAIMQAMHLAMINGVQNQTPTGVTMQGEFDENTTILRFAGYSFRPLAESYLYGVEADSLLTSTIPGQGTISHEKNCRIFVSLVKNIGVTTSAKSISSADGVALKIHPSSQDESDGVTIIKGNMNWGSGVIDFKQTIAGYASSDSFI